MVFTPDDKTESKVLFLIDPRIAIPIYLVLIFLTPQQYRGGWYLIWFGGCVISAFMGPTPIRGAEGSPINRRQYIAQQFGFSILYWLGAAGLIAAAIDNLFL